jgi:hypothetical protein
MVGAVCCGIVAQVYDFAPLAIRLITPPKQLEVGLLTAKVGKNTFT